MSITKNTILYDPINHYNLGFHHTIISHPPAGVTFKASSIEYLLPEAMVANANSTVGENFLSIGKFQSGKQNILLFSPHTLLTNEKPWIMDLEHVDWLFINDYVLKEREKLIPYWKLKLAMHYLHSKYCKKILCMSKAAFKSLIETFDDEIISQKSILFYPVQEYRPKTNRKKKNAVRLLFICSEYAHWYRKGGDIAILVFLKLKKEFPELELHYIGKLPERISYFPRLFFRKEDVKKISGFFHYDNMKHKELLSKIYPLVDILLFPSRADTFGTTVLEAMSFGITVIASSGNHVFGTQDVIENGKNGFLVFHNDNYPSHALAKNINKIEFIKITKTIIESADLRLKIGENARRLFKNSQFSIPSMQRILNRIVSEI